MKAYIEGHVRYNLVLKIYDLDDVPLVYKDNLAEEAQKSDLGHHEVFLV